MSAALVAAAVDLGKSPMEVQVKRFRSIQVVKA
jgi:hypothetical protein